MSEKRPSHCLSKADMIGYLNGNLTPANVYRIETHLIDCQFCDTAIKGYAEQQDAISILNSDTYFETMLLEEINTTAPIRKTKRLKTAVWLSAAAILVALPLGYHFYTKTTISPEIAAEYNNLMPAPQVIVRGQNKTGSTPTEQAFLAYEQADYATSFTQFQKIATNEPQNTLIAFYAGLSAYGKKDWKTAQTYFEKVHLSEPNPSSSNAVWYLAMLELQQNKTQRAQELLQELASSPNEWQEKAKTMLVEIGN